MKFKIFLIVIMIQQVVLAGPFFSTPLIFEKRGSLPLQLNPGENRVLIQTFCLLNGELVFYSKNQVCRETFPYPSDYYGNPYKNYQPAQMITSTTFGGNKTYTLRTEGGSLLAERQKMRHSDFLRLSQVNPSPESPIVLILNQDLEIVRVIESN